MTRFSSISYWLLWSVFIILAIISWRMAWKRESFRKRALPLLRLSLYLWSVVSLVMIAAVVIYLTTFDGWKDLTRGRVHRIAHDIFSDTASLTRIEIFLLDGDDSQKANTRFEWRGTENGDPIYGETTVSGGALRGFLETWNGQPLNGSHTGAMCHDPPYGFRGYDGDRLVFETTICWRCQNIAFVPFHGSEIYYGFDSESDIAKELLNRCDQLLPYKRH
ncbi:hypothetical protein FEM03_00540 [Phragmitibacter flavus]|uniref:Uncharacterized protein n=1 Tax=Phragmitibacter flavus TaxID=2576071 RepID=A0A5R8KJU7_9BACT|nr:hypothetical protein [Phragmitibacter flavus]TLD72598.1 hypothetical protein FEM03_00540 [Phragmitibacter flavus]